MSLGYDKTRGVKILGFHTYKDFKALLKHKEISSPEPQRVKIEIPGMDGVIDMTNSVYGKTIRYKNRKLLIQIRVMDIGVNWASVYSNILNTWHGQSGRIVFDDDPTWYWVGDINVKSMKEDGIAGDIEIECDVDPYKYCTDSMMATNDKWKWNELNFINGVIIPNGWLISFDQTDPIEIINPYTATRPIFTCTGPCELQYVDAEGSTCKLSLPANTAVTGQKVAKGVTSVKVIPQELCTLQLKLEERKSL